MSAHGRQVREPIVLRLSQLKRILGIEVEPAVVRRILTALGNEEAGSGRGTSAAGRGAGSKEQAAERSPCSPLLAPRSLRSSLPPGGAISRGRST